MSGYSKKDPTDHFIGLVCLEEDEPSEEEDCTWIILASEKECVHVQEYEPAREQETETVAEKGIETKRRYPSESG